jgi:serine/threonine protein kinase/Tfp pilus assembly protein PilF
MSEPRTPDKPDDPSSAETIASELRDPARQPATGSSGSSDHDDTIAASSLSYEPSGTSSFGALPDVFASYKLVRELHRGGQGVVYLAMQQSTRRKVAIKVMREGPFGGPRDKARFEREVHILGQLKHPNIVAIHECGIVAGNDYFVMDYVSGQPLDEYVRHHRLSLRQTLELFAGICRAVNAAHIRGIIHRDLKPSNIRIDTEGNPYVLDFGLAKSLAGDSEADMITITGQFVGSLPWASPEQAEAAPSKIDIRTDVYSLGVILYQMLTGKLPYEVSGSVSDALSNIRNAAPARPSTIHKWINNEVETIVLKCMAKERERRYQTAGEVDRDVQHYLNGEPIEAKRDSAWYLLSKTLRRYRGRAATAAAGLVMLIAFAASMTFAYSRVAEEARKSRLVAGFLDGILTSVDPDVARQGFDTPLHAALRETLDNAASRIDELEREPDVQARVRTTIGRVYMNLGLYPGAAEQFRAALAANRQLHGDNDAATAETMHLLGAALKETAAHQEAERYYQDALALRRALFGDDSLPVADTLNGLGQLHFVQRDYEAAEPLLRAALEIRRDRADARDVATSAANLGSLLRDQQRLAEAEPLLREALEMRLGLYGEAHFHSVVSMNKLALLLRQHGNIAEARTLFERALELRRRLVGHNHPHVGASLNNLGLVLLDEGLYPEAARCFAEATEIWRATLAPDDPRVGRSLVNHAVCLRRAGEFESAVAICRQALDNLPPDSPDAAAATLTLAKLQTDTGQPAEAETTLRALLTTIQSRLPAGHPFPALVSCELARCLTETARFDEAERLLLAAREQLDATYGPTDRRTTEATHQLVSLYEQWGKPDRAAAYRAALPPESR